MRMAKSMRKPTWKNLWTMDGTCTVNVKVTTYMAQYMGIAKVVPIFKNDMYI